MSGYGIPLDTFFEHVQAAGVESLVCVGTNADDSLRAITMAKEYLQCYASVGLHPHEAKELEQQQAELSRLARQSEVVAIGECGLDYYYNNSLAELQRAALIWQLDLAHEHGLPLIFHVRDGGGSREDAFRDFFSVIDEQLAKGHRARGVVHSFTSSKRNMRGCIDRGLYIGLNGITTFTKDESQLEAVRGLPLQNLVLETDAPFLTPVPFRGTINHSGHVRTVAEFLSKLRGETLQQIAAATTANAKELFRI